MRRKRVFEIGFGIEPFCDMVIFDLETTGLVPRFNDIIQIAAVRMIGGRSLKMISFFHM